MVVGQVTFFVNRSQLKLVGSNLVVTGFNRNTQFQTFYFKILHESCHTGGDSTKVMVFQLLVFRAFVTHQGATGKQQVGTGGIQAFVNQKVFLFPAKVSNHLLNLGVEVVTYCGGRLINCFQGFDKRSLIV